MFYLKRIEAILESRETREKLALAAGRLAKAGIELVDKGASLCGKEGGISGVLWITDSAPAAKALMEAQKPLLVCLHDGNRDADFGAAGFVVEEPQEQEAKYFEQVYRRFAGIPWDIAETPRCLIREMCPEDAPRLEEIYAEPSVNRFLGGFYPEEVRGDAEQKRLFLEKYIQNVYGFYGYGIWTVVEKESGEIIGRAGFRSGGDGIPDLGYVIDPVRQRRGFGFEVCGALLRYGAEELGFRQVKALVEPDNLSSAALCRKLGFAERGSVCEDGKRYLQFTKGE